MTDYISREAAKAFFTPRKGVTVLTPITVTVESLLATIDNVPAADVRPVVRGKWIDDKGNLVPWDELNKNCPSDSASCSVCGEWLTASDEYPVIGNYCPNCGADMRRES
jgi:hypothetical protein